MVSPKLIEAWFSLMSEAMRGSSDAQEAFKMLSGTSMTTDDMSRWMSRFMPTGASMSAGQPEMFGEWVEQWWRAMGVVPRQRYLDLLERNESLRLRLEECEKTRKQHSMLDVSGQQEQAQKALNLWGTAMEDMLKMQADWMRTWFPKERDATGAQEGAAETGAAMHASTHAAPAEGKAPAEGPKEATKHGESVSESNH